MDFESSVIRYQQEYDALAESMDAQESYFNKLLVYAEQHGDVPAEYQENLEIAKKHTPWRDDPVVLKYIHMAAQKAANMSEEERLSLRSNREKTRKAVKKAVKTAKREARRSAK